MKRPTMLFFDVNETLLDLKAMRTNVAQALGGRSDLLPLWFTTMLQYSLVATVGDHYNDFGEIGAAALMMLARNNQLSLSQEAARSAMLPMQSLPPHADAASALGDLKQEGFRMVTLTNSSQAAIDAQIRNSGLEELFEARLSIEEVRLFKPHRKVYNWAAGKMVSRLTSVCWWLLTAGTSPVPYGRVGGLHLFPGLALSAIRWHPNRSWQNPICEGRLNA
jgi:2-haloacid dehalogenase